MGILDELRQAKKRSKSSPGFPDRTIQRGKPPDWHARWHALTPAARAAFLEIKGPGQPQNDHNPLHTMSRDQFAPAVVDELAAAGFLAIQPADSKPSGDRVHAPAVVYDFVTRLRMINRYRLLRGEQPTDLKLYVEQAFRPDDLYRLINEVLRKAGIHDYGHMAAWLERYVKNPRWPAWVGLVWQDAMANRVVRAINEAGRSIPRAEVPGLVPNEDSEQVRLVVDNLIGRLVLFEDLDPGTFDIVVGFLPSVREGMARLVRPPVRPPLVVCDRPVEVSLDEGPIAADLRAFLLEVAAEPPRLRQDGSLFQKEVDRFMDGLDPLPEWLTGLMRWTREERASLGLTWARSLELVDHQQEGNQVRLRLTTRGHQWLASGLDAQYAGIHGLLNASPASSGYALYGWHGRLFSSGSDAYDDDDSLDARFLGSAVFAQKKGKERRYPTNYWTAKPDDIQALRDAVDQALATLEPGVFYREDSVVAHLAYGTHNPLNLGLAPEQVDVIVDQRLNPPLEEVREQAGRSLLQTFIERRLIPLGCVRAAIDVEGKLCVARTPRLDAYFGRTVAAAEMAPAGDAAAKVVVQPDFSVIVIGLNPTVAAELAPFCDRASGGSRGAVILKITRDSVVRAVANGLKGTAIVDRLRRHASHEVPANVLHEVRAWSDSVRRVTPATLAVLRCPDPDTADRVMGALKRQSERLNDTTVALGEKLTAAERNKLRLHGIIVEGPREAPESRMRPKKKRAR